jgi:hypothetical protein
VTLPVYQSVNSYWCVHSVLKRGLITDWSFENMKITKDKIKKKIGLQASKFNNIDKGALHLHGESALQLRGKFT